ncbi:uncharacterized protein BO88DRAFT_91447 [Aspergillus vadensis CBS 113365]|uniref:Uncharacterized protein n=1 Tax=Aspergillus vadensis (strain CBS 113365 / IMI 142717 / IBT 24658) TaxID=1448311 RepID=A0A319BKM2_ASPVC|nr:hypothetical protein BO88DRAFT_91447 [Aspergillus vadensis CBS 113365]PYH73255.1 hypothetical protein BO88DRAFT_91447 [Aspergillus vadensis CBS 113365]
MEVIVINRSWSQFGREKGGRRWGGGERQEKEGPVASWSTGPSSSLSQFSQSVSLSPALVSRPDRSMENRACAILWGGRMRRFKVRVGDFPGSSGYFANRIRSIRCCRWDP